LSSDYSGRDLTRTAARTEKRRRRNENRERLPIDRFWRRALAAAVAGVELVLLAWLVGAPLLPVRDIRVTGVQHLTRDQVVAAAGLGRPGSIVAVDGDTIRRKLERLAWVRTASVTPRLPDQVAIAITEWRPVALYRPSPTGPGYYLSDQAAVLAPGQPAPGMLLLVGGGGAAPKPGDHPLDAQLLQALRRIQGSFPTLYPGQQVAQFDLDCTGLLTATTDKGVKVIFGRVVTPEQFSALAPKLSALKAVAGQPDVQKGPVEYINLENANAPAVHFKGQAPPPSPSPSPGTRTPSPSPSPSPAIVASTPCR
jgi:cell division septal protein FtsQ